MHLTLQLLEQCRRGSKQKWHTYSYLARYQTILKLQTSEPHLIIQLLNVIVNGSRGV